MTSLWAALNRPLPRSRASRYTIGYADGRPSRRRLSPALTRPEGSPGPRLATRHGRARLRAAHWLSSTAERLADRIAS